MWKGKKDLSPRITKVERKYDMDGGGTVVYMSFFVFFFSRSWDIM
jgi:hypothetical protein